MELIKRLHTPIEHIQLKPIDFDDTPPGSYKITRNIAAQMVHDIDNMIFSTIMKTAEEEGITDLYLIDKNFVISAIREKIESEKERKNENN